MTEATTPNYEAQAKELGWVPKEQFKGDESRWVDAETFVKRGEEVMPILKANNKRLHQQVDTLSAQLSEARTAIQESQQAIATLRETQTEMTKAAVARSKAEIRGQLRAAREANDMQLVADLEDQLEDIRDAEREVKTKTAAPAPKPNPQQPQLDPEFIAWQRDNPWFGTDTRRTALAVAEAKELRQSGDQTIGRAFYDKAAAAADAILNPSARPTKVETGSGTGAPSQRSGGPKKGYRDLPADAQAVCDRQAEMVVGKNRAFKTAAEWQQHYADLFFAE